MVPVVLNSSCEACRGSKVKCSGERICQRCSSKNITCVYHPRKRRGKPRDKDTKYDDFLGSISGNVSMDNANRLISPSFYPTIEENEVLGFCIKSGFPIKFINALIRAGVTSFQLASEITEPELMERFGPLSYDQLLLWRTKIRETMYKSFAETRTDGFPNLLTQQKLSPSTFEESQCAQFLSNLKTQAQIMNPGNILMKYPGSDITNVNTSTNNNNCLFSQLYKSILGGGGYKKRKVEDEISNTVSPNPPSIEDKIQQLSVSPLEFSANKNDCIKQNMEIVDWLVKFLQGLCKCDIDVYSEEKQMKECLDEVVKTIESFNTADVAKCESSGSCKDANPETQSLCQLKKRTLTLIQQQFDLLKSKLS